MDIFRSEQTRVEGKIIGFLLELESIGAQGRFVNEKLHRLQQDIKYYSKDTAELKNEFSKAQDQVQVYADMTNRLIQDFTKLLTKIR